MAAEAAFFSAGVGATLTGASGDRAEVGSAVSSSVRSAVGAAVGAAPAAASAPASHVPSSAGATGDDAPADGVAQA